MKVSAIIVAAGNSKRMKRAFRTRKPYILLGGKPILAHTLAIFESLKSINEIILVANKKDITTTSRSVVKKYKFKKIKKIIAGGKTRADSVSKGLKVVDKNAELILIHDGVRPFVSKGTVTKCMLEAKKFGAAILAIPATSTIKQSNEGNFVKLTTNRCSLWEVQTPQVFKKALILAAYKKAGRNRCHATDDSCLVEKLGQRVKIVNGLCENIKITTPFDLIVGEAILNASRYRI